MRGRLYDRWLTEGAGATLSEFVAEERARGRQFRAQRRWARVMAPMMQQAPPSYVLMQQLGMQNAPPNLYHRSALGGIGNLLSLLGSPTP